MRSCFNSPVCPCGMCLVRYGEKHESRRYEREQRIKQLQDGASSSKWPQDQRPQQRLITRPVEDTETLEGCLKALKVSSSSQYLLKALDLTPSNERIALVKQYQPCISYLHILLKVLSKLSPDAQFIIANRFHDMITDAYDLSKILNVLSHPANMDYWTCSKIISLIDKELNQAEGNECVLLQQLRANVMLSESIAAVNYRILECRIGITSQFNATTPPFAFLNHFKPNPYHRIMRVLDVCLSMLGGHTNECGDGEVDCRVKV